MATQKKIVLTAEDRTKPAFRSAKRSMNSLEGAASGLQKTFALLAGATGLALVARSFINAADRATQLENKLKLVTGTSKDLTRVYGTLFELSKSTRVSFEATSELYARLARSSDHLGLSEKDLLQITESLNQAFAVSGAGIMETASAVRQLGQGLASGRLAGDELRAIMENAPRVAKMIATGMGTTIGQLRRMGSEGKLNAESVTKAILKQSEVIQEEFDKTQGTVEQASTKMGDSWMNFVNVVDETTGTTGVITVGLERMSRGLDKISRRISGEDPFGLYGMSLKQLREELTKTGQEFENWHNVPTGMKSLPQVEGGDLILFEKMSQIKAKIAEKTGQIVVYEMEVSEEAKKQVNYLDEISGYVDKTHQDLASMSNVVYDTNLLFGTQRDIIEAGTKALGDRLDIIEKLATKMLAIDARIEGAGETAEQRKLKRIKKNAQIELNLNREFYDKGGQTFEEYEARKGAIVKDTQEKIDETKEEGAEQEKQLNVARLTSAIGTTTSMAAALKDESRQLFDFWKAMAIAEATINTYNAATSAMKIPYVGVALASAMVALGMMYVQKIAAMEPPPKQYGGGVTGGKKYLVGEKGPELFTPSNAGQITPNNQVGGSTNVNFKITAINARGIDQLLTSRRDMIIGMINEAQSRKLRRGL